MRYLEKTAELETIGTVERERASLYLTCKKTNRPYTNKPNVPKSTFSLREREKRNNIISISHNSCNNYTASNGKHKLSIWRRWNSN